MKSRYDKVMERIEVTPAMHERIMKRLSDLDFDLKNSQVKSFNNYRKLLSIAACFLLLLASSFLIYNNVYDKKPPVQIVSGVVECPCIDKLSETVGFKVSQVQMFPFKVEQVKYVSYWGKLAQITYSKEGNTLAFRMSVGSEDNSGDYSEYGNIKTISTGNLAVTLKGQEEIYKLAIWYTNGYSYSINVSNGISQEEMVKIVESVQ